MDWNWFILLLHGKLGQRPETEVKERQPVTHGSNALGTEKRPLAAPFANTYL